MKRLFILAVTATAIVALTGCAKLNPNAPAQPENPSAAPAVDEKAQARTELFNDVGLDETGKTNQPEIAPLALPSVLPTPPTLPATDNGDAVLPVTQ